MVVKYRPFVSGICRILRQLLQPGISPEHDIGGITNPFLQVRGGVRVHVRVYVYVCAYRGSGWVWCRLSQ